MAARLLITGFGAFPGIAANPSEALIGRLRAAPPPLPGDMTCTFHVLPVTWAMLSNELPRLHAAHTPAAIIQFGVAGRRRMISIETRARNAAATRQRDAAGHRSSRALLENTGPKSRPATLPARALVTAIRAAGVPVRASRDAGDYLCNATLWTSLAAGFPATFVHLPRVGRPGGLGLNDLERAARAVVTAVASRMDPSGGQGVDP